MQRREQRSRSGPRLVPAQNTHPEKHPAMIPHTSVVLMALACGLGAGPTFAQQVPPRTSAAPATVSAGSASRLAAPQVLERISPAQLQEIFKEEGYSFTPDADGDVVWKIDGVKTMVLRSEKGNQLSFVAAFKSTEKTTLVKVNEWNRTKKFSRSYLDKDGDPMLQLDLDLEGGIAKPRITDFLKTCRVSLAAWIREVL